MNIVITDRLVQFSPFNRHSKIKRVTLRSNSPQLALHARQQANEIPNNIVAFAQATASVMPSNITIASAARSTNTLICTYVPYYRSTAGLIAIGSHYATS